MNHLSLPHGILARQFRARYLESLREYRFFYDDIAEIGNPASAEHVFYFVPGINGTPGQMRFILPSLTRVYGDSIYLKALQVPAFSARRPMWEKYSESNVNLKLECLARDLEEMLTRHRRITVIASSNGFYDFAAVAGTLPADELRERVTLLWGACAPDHFEHTPWEDVFYPVNGFDHEGHRWFAYPNHNAFTVLNPETGATHVWRDGPRRRRLHKIDLESRFHCLGLQWSYISVSQLGSRVQQVVSRIKGPVPCRTLALVAANDGYWQGRPQAGIEEAIRKYAPECDMDFRPASHLWVVTPHHATSLFERARNLGPVVESPSVFPEARSLTPLRALVDCRDGMAD